MNKYTAEFVEAEVEVAMSQGKHGTAAMFRDYAALLRERESAKAAVTEDSARKLGDEYFRLCKLANRDPLQAGFWIAQLRAALEAVAPMLASAREGDPVAVIGDVYTIHWIGPGPITPIIEKHNLKAGDFLYAKPPVLASAWMSVEMPAEFGEWFGKNYPGPDTIIGNPHWHAPRIWRAARRAMLATAPKHESEE